VTTDNKNSRNEQNQNKNKKAVEKNPKSSLKAI